MPVSAGHQGVQLPPGVTHTLTVALSSAEGAYRTSESGLLNQLLLLVLAVPAGSPAAAQLGSLRKAVAVADVVGTTGGAAADAGASQPAESGAAGAAARAGNPGVGGSSGGSSGSSSGGWRVFVVGRQATVALVRRAGEVRRMLDVEAKPFVSDSLRRVFDARPDPFLLGGCSACLLGGLCF